MTAPTGPAPLTQALEALLGRQSVGSKHLAEPGPTDAELGVMVQAALRAPDHALLVPFRFAVIRGPARERFAALLERAARDAGKAPDAAGLDRERALRPPVTLALVARIDSGHPIVPAHEQWMTVGGALANLLTAAHALGYAGKMLSGAKARAPAVVAGFCSAGEVLVGWVALGTPLQPAAAHEHRKPPPDSLLRPWDAGVG